MSCFLPPLCIFCKYYLHTDQAESSISCSAFETIPDEIFQDEIMHLEPLEGDNNLQFEINPDMRDEYDDVNEMRKAMGMPAFPALSASLTT